MRRQDYDLWLEQWKRHESRTTKWLGIRTLTLFASWGLLAWLGKGVPEHNKVIQLCLLLGLLLTTVAFLAFLIRDIRRAPKFDCPSCAKNLANDRVRVVNSGCCPHCQAVVLEDVTPRTEYPPVAAVEAFASVLNQMQRRSKIFGRWAMAVLLLTSTAGAAALVLPILVFPEWSTEYPAPWKGIGLSLIAGGLLLPMVLFFMGNKNSKEIPPCPRCGAILAQMELGNPQRAHQVLQTRCCFDCGLEALSGKPQPFLAPLISQDLYGAWKGKCSRVRKGLSYFLFIALAIGCLLFAMTPLWTHHLSARIFPHHAIGWQNEVIGRVPPILGLIVVHLAVLIPYFYKHPPLLCPACHQSMGSASDTLEFTKKCPHCSAHVLEGREDPSPSPTMTIAEYEAQLAAIDKIDPAKFKAYLRRWGLRGAILACLIGAGWVLLALPYPDHHWCQDLFNGIAITLGIAFAMVIVFTLEKAGEPALPCCPRCHGKLAMKKHPSLQRRVLATGRCPTCWAPVFKDAPASSP